MMFTQQNTSAMSLPTLFRSLPYPKCQPRVLKGLVLFLLALFVSMFITPTRNLLLYPVWPKAWKYIHTHDILFMEMSTSPKNVTSLDFCLTTSKPNVSTNDPRLNSLIQYPDLESGNFTLRHSEHVRFLPALTYKEKLGYLHLFLVITDSLTNAGVKFFIRAGTLLGLHRHGGFIPWDDDIDIAVNVSDWEKVREKLSCIEGYKLKILPGRMHWKFCRTILPFPFVDIFFYTENEKFVYALTSYTRRTFALPREHVFPLTTGLFEGLTVPIPRHTDYILKRIYDYDKCQSRSYDHTKGEPTTNSVVVLPCSSLSYMYNNVYHLTS